MKRRSGPSSTGSAAASASVGARCGKFGTVLSFGLFLGILGCGATRTSRDGDAGGTAANAAGAGTSGVNAGGSGSSSVFASPQSCSEYGIDIRLGCEACPVSTPTCACLDGFGFLPAQACTFGKCLAGVDCDRVCRTFDNFGPEFNEYIEALRKCFDVLTICKGDADCGSGKCRFESATDPGTCGSGDASSTCGNDADCLNGYACVRGSGDPIGLCSAGHAHEFCNTKEDCEGGYACIHDPSVPLGTCSTGENGERCVLDDDCLVSHHCVGPKDDGRCSAGAVDDPCGKPSDCQSGFCFADRAAGHPFGTCTTGLIGSSCLEPEGCQSGRCAVALGNHEGICVSGNDGSMCFNDVDCASGLCALNTNGTDGICAEGKIGSACFDDSDCREGTCLSPSSTSTATCLGQPGSPCEGDGVCVDRGECCRGKCG